MEGNSCSSICFDAVNVKKEPEYRFNEQVHVKEEVVECLKEEAAWEHSAAAGSAAALARLYAGHEVKDELVLGPEGLQPRDVAFTLYGLSARARGCHRDHTYARTECPPEVHVKEEVVECLKEEAAWEHSAAAGSAAALARLYAGHEVKDELVLGPEGPQPRDVVFTLYAAQALAVKKQHKLRDCAVRLERIDAPAPLSIQQRQVHPGTEQEDDGLSARARGCHRDHTYARTECPPEVLARAGGRGEARGRGSAGERGHCCQTCNHTFKTQSHLKIHERIHTGERPYSCGTCNKKFTHLGNLKNHERTHTGEKPFSCGICNQTFTESGHLKSHERIHTGVRPYSCGTCNKKFTQLTHLKTHERTHTGEKPFSCGICQQKFSVSGSLKRHERTHTGQKPFACDVCKKQFTELRNLKKHKDRFHADQKPFCCDICQKWFAQKTTLVGHLRRHRTAKPR